MAGRKQVMDMRSETKVTSRMESNEQQRNWSNEHWEKKSNDSLANYDRTRSHLNFEVVKGGKVQPIDTSKTIAEKLEESLTARGIRMPNSRPDSKRKPRILAKFIFGGNRERMQEIAFGDQIVNFTKGADNSHLVRSKDAERWAQDVYNFVAKRFGEDNIIGFYVHLDEKNMHVHCTVVPVGENNKISWKSVFGKTLQEESAHMTALHNAFAEEVGKKWGLERGDSKEQTKAKHRSTEEYKQRLVNEVCDLETTRQGLLQQIHRAEIKLKGISTMIANLQERKEKVQEQIDSIARQFGQEGVDSAELVQRMASLRKELEGIDDKLAERYKMLNDANTTLSEAKAKLDEMKRQHSHMNDLLGDDMDRQAAEIQKNIITTYNNMMTQSLKPLLPTLSHDQQALLDESGFTELSEQGTHVINCAMLLALRYVQEATHYAESVGGGGSPGTGWGKDKDEYDERWWRRCIAQSAAMIRNNGQRRKRGR
jgi:predicted  nucleic acid-binding Zn-ribbon protein